ncbi:MAG TPA: AsmA family protein [Microvirga sp.]|jgi:AsmA protein|nr:AsmA family protein [Microvirga sp.]
MSRRVVLAFALLGLALLAAAVAPWTLSPGGFAAAVAQHLKEDYGLAFQVHGRSTIALLPMPRVKFQDVTIRSPEGAVLAEGGTLRGQLELLPLLLGQAELAEVSLTDSRITVAVPAAGLVESSLAAFLRTHGPGRARDLPHVRRVRLVNSSIRFPGGTPPVDSATLTLDWPDPDGPLQGSGTLSWNGDTVEVTRFALDPAAIAAGRLSPFAAAVGAPAAQFTVAGEVQPGPELRFTGHSTVQAHSVRDLSRWTGIAFPLGNLLQAAAIEGDFTADRRRISWPSVRVIFGADRLEGTLAMRFDGERPAVTGTLAAGRLTLSDLLAPFGQARTASGLWSGDEVSLLPMTGADLDLRVSASDARVGGLSLGEMAASVMVRPGRIEAAIGRATLNGGTLKGRMALAAVEGGGLDLKLQCTFGGVDLGAFLTDARRPRWITGSAQGQFALEGTGTTPADIVRQSHGRTNLTVKQGELVGIALNDALRRLEKRPLLAFLDWRGGRTPFDEAHVHLNIGAGLGEITEGAVLAPKLRAILQGRVSLIDRDVAVRAHVDAVPAEADASFLVLDVLGGWDAISVVPDARSLIERSGAAKPLFGRERLQAPAAQGAAAAPLAQ